MELTLAQLAEQLDVELRGDGNVRITAVAPLQEGRPEALSFLANPKYRRYLKTTQAGVVVLSGRDVADSPVPVLVSDNPYACYARAVRLIYPPDAVPVGIHPAAVVDPEAHVDPDAWIDAGSIIAAGVRIGPSVQVGPGCMVGTDVVIGEGSQLVARVTVLAATRIGKRVILHPGAVVGSDGFGMAQIDGHWAKVPQLGSVCVGDDVDIGANTTIDRGALQDTVIEAGVKIDNQVQVGHNVFIGAHTAIAGCVGISGSTRIGRHCTLAGGVGLVGHLEIADNVHITAMSMVTHSISEPGTYSAGTPLMKNSLWRRNAVRIKQLDALVRRVSAIEKNLNNK
ncbi:MAG: UDP-3-O-(3-hydroxymyristoyl)glucosamine N-acyltransferase [Gammaproteobacteria bacterium]|nr:MAG: UDP-3-O-(3-hydroxymyristoyl)glucosamine N-acyltransferase [Gammaproteobacteria bacterium]